MIRLPPSYLDLVGKSALVYETNQNGKRALLITFDEVIQPISLNDRLSALEKTVESLLKRQNPNGLVEIRTRDLRRVKATS